MPQAEAQELPTLLSNILQWLGVTSLTGAVAALSAWVSFPPELVLEAVTDKSKKFQCESRIKIKNIGKLPAREIRYNADQLTVDLGNFVLENCSILYVGTPQLHRLAGGESAEISIAPNMNFGNSAQATRFSYVLVLEYSAKLFILRKNFVKRYKVDLRTFEDGYSWNIAHIR